MLHSHEWEELTAMFEREFSHRRLDREPKEMWPKRVIYQDGNTNDLFLAYQSGYAFGKAVHQS